MAKKQFEVEDKKYIVKKPNPQQLSKAQEVAGKSFNEGVKRKDLPRARIKAYLRENGLWSDEKEQELIDLSKKIYEGERQLARGGRTDDGKKFSKTDARGLAIDMRVWRIDQATLLMNVNQLDEHSVEGKAENAKFDFLVSQCTYYTNGNKVFKDVDDYVLKSDEEFAIKAAQELGSLLFSLDPDFEKNKAENKFLVEYGFAREDMRLVNKDKELVDVEGNVINEEGYRVDKKGNRVDTEGRPLDKDGNPVEKFTPFED